MVRVHHAQWYVPKNRGELPWLTDELKLVRRQIWNFKDGKAAPWAQEELTALIQMVGWDQGGRILVPIPASTMQRTLARGLANLVEVICSRCDGLVNGTDLIHRFEDVEAKHKSESRGRGPKGLYFDAANIAESRIVLLDDVVTKGHTIVDLAEVLRNLGASSVEAVTLARTVPPGGVIENGRLVLHTDSTAVVTTTEAMPETDRTLCPAPEFKDDDDFLTPIEVKSIRALGKEACDFEGDHPEHGAFRYSRGLKPDLPNGIGMARLTVDYGIDLGLHHSVIARMERGEAVIKKNDLLSDRTPSAVAFSSKGRIRVGQQAFNQLKSDRLKSQKSGDFKPNVFVEFRRTMGTDEKYSPAIKPVPVWTSEQLSAEVLKKLKGFVNDETVHAAVITIPAEFKRPQQQATLQAAELAGFKQSRLLQEPVAAAMAYGLDAGSEKGKWLVFDFGGRSFDSALVLVEDGVITVKDSEGDNFLGGKDLDKVLVDEVIIPAVQQDYDIDNILSDSNKKENFRMAMKKWAEETKIKLSYSETHEVVSDLGEIPLEDANGEEIELDFVVTREKMAEAVRPIFQRAIDKSLALLARHGLKGADLDELILVGGPTLSPILREMLADQMKAPNTSVDPMTCVARGAALFASTVILDEATKKLVEEEASEEKELVVLDVQYESTAVSSMEFVTVKVKEGEAGGASVELARPGWSSGKVSIGDKGALVEVSLEECKSNAFEVIFSDEFGNRLNCHPSLVTIMGLVTVPEFKDDDEFLTPMEVKSIHALGKRAHDFEGNHPKYGSFRYAGGMKSGLPNGIGMALFNKGAKYLGHWLDGCMSGPGKMNISNWGKFRGNWLNGAMHGVMVSHDAAAKFSGFYVHGEPSTGMRESISSGNVYEGEFKNGKPHGDGKLRFPSGSEFTGRFANGQRDGKGRFVHSGFGVIEGVWSNGSLEGHARIDRKKNGDVYEGEVSKGLPDGFGKFIYSNGDRFEGNHRKGKRHGQGKLTKKLGEVWTGEWKGKDRFSGEARLKNGARYKGVFTKGAWDELVTVRYRNGDWYKGPVKNWKRNGTGKLKSKKGEVFEGQFRNDIYSGKGVRTLACKDRISGSWKKGASHGPVKIEYADGAVWAGRHKSGLPNGPARYMSKCGRFHFALDYIDGKVSEATLVVAPFLNSGETKSIQLTPNVATRIWARSYLALEAAGVNMRRLKGPKG